MMTLEKSWHAALDRELNLPYIAQLKQFLSERRASGCEIFPPSPEIFQALKWTPYSDVKVVIVGQDPYHGPGQAHGLCFSVQKGVRVPPSLKNIYKELQSDLGIEPALHGNLESWAKQGVLLLNATLTVEQGRPKSHYGRGWERFTDAVIRSLVERKDPVIFVLWGRSAREKCAMVQGSHHVVLESAHPSPFSATKFFGCRHFSKVNAILGEWGKEPIDWSVD